MALGGSKLVWLTGLGFFFSTFWFTFRNQGDKLDMLGCNPGCIIIFHTRFNQTQGHFVAVSADQTSTEEPPQSINK